MKQSIVMFAKYWQPGLVKTRLGKSIGNERAASLYHQFLRLLLEQVPLPTRNRSPDLLDTQEHWLAYSPEDYREAFERLVSGLEVGWKLIPQSSGGLGQRIIHCAKNIFQTDSEAVVIIGSDSPWLTHSDLAEAFSALEHGQFVLGPATDGGYYLVGFRREVGEVFEDTEFLEQWNRIRWSTSHTFEDTMKALERCGLCGAETPRGFDVDSMDDLQVLRKKLVDVEQALSSDQAERFRALLIDDLSELMNN